MNENVWAEAKAFFCLPGTCRASIQSAASEAHILPIIIRIMVADELDHTSRKGDTDALAQSAPAPGHKHPVGQVPVTPEQV